MSVFILEIEKESESEREERENKKERGKATERERVRETKWVRKRAKEDQNLLLKHNLSNLLGKLLFGIDIPKVPNFKIMIK